MDMISKEMMRSLHKLKYAHKCTEWSGEYGVDWDESGNRLI